MTRNPPPPARIVAAPPGEARSGLLLLCPHFAGLGPQLADLAAVLPTRGINEGLIGSLGSRPLPPGQGEVFGGILAVDPFVTGPALFRALVRRGLKGVVNLPTVAFAEGEFRRALQAGSMDHSRELETLAAARSHGLDGLAVVFSVDQALAARSAGLDRVVIHPGLISGNEEDRRHLGEGVAAVVQRLRSLAPELAILVYRHPTLGRHLDLAVAAADGEVIWAVEGASGVS